MIKLKELRKKENKTIEEMAKELGLPKTTYYNYESGRNEIDRKTLIKMANYFNVSLDYLCDRPFNNNVGYISEERKNLIKQLNEISDKEFNDISLLVKGYLTGKSGSINFKVFD